MTTPEATRTDLPLPSIQPKRRLNWTAIRRWSIAVTMIAVVVGPLTWWLVSAYANVLQPGGGSYFGTATILQAGNATEYCYPDKPGSTFIFGFSIHNTGNHDVTVRSIDEIIGMADQKITIDPETNGGSDGPGASTQTLPLTIHPGQERELYVTMQLSTDIVDSGGGESSFDSVELNTRSLGINRTQQFAFGDDQHPLWIGISGIDKHGRSCNRTQAPLN